MIAAQQVLQIIQRHVPRKQWVSSKDIYAIVESHGMLDAEDRQPRSPGSNLPRWKGLVRNVLAHEMKVGKVRSRKRSGHAGEAGTSPHGSNN